MVIMADLEKLALKLASDGPVRVLATPRLVQATLNGIYVFRTTQAQFVWEHPFYPQYYVPARVLEANPALTITPGETFSDAAGHAIATQWHLSAGGRTISDVLAFGATPPAPAHALRDLVKLDFASLDQWFEEATPIHVHPKDPFKRVDVLAATRRVVVRVAGHVVADSPAAMHLHETGLPVRFYLPPTSVRPDVLRPSATRTRCPYKGEARYYSVEVGGERHEDLVWYYEAPVLEVGGIIGLLCFYNEKVDIELDGEKLERPDTHFGRGKPGTKPPLA
nr:hypothetical protein CFP56_04333 [Quercus suber]